jgi:hypothetical protein
MTLWLHPIMSSWSPYDDSVTGMVVAVSMLIPSPNFPSASYCCGLVNCSVQDAATLFLSSWWVKLQHAAPETQSELARLLPPTNQGGPGRVALIPLATNWTIYMDNRSIGADPAGVLWAWAANGCKSIAALHKSSPEQYGVRIVVLDPIDPPVIRRTISCTRDYKRWEFWMEGEPFEFEDISAYSRRIKRERFTPDMLEYYLLALGVPPLNATNIDFPGALVLEDLSKPVDRRTGIHSDIYKHGLYPPSDWVSF